MRKEEVIKLIDALIKPGQDRYAERHIRSVYARGYLTSLLADLAVNDSDILRKLIRKFEEQRNIRR